VEKRARKFMDVASRIEPPVLSGADADDAEITLIGWGSTRGVIREAVEILNRDGIAVNQLPVKWIVPLHAEAIAEVFANAKRTVIVENNHSGQFHRYLRGETGLTADGHIRKYDGEPFMPHHIVDGVKELLAGKTDIFVPYQEVIV